MVEVKKNVEIDKIDVEELLQVFKDINQDAFILYVKSVWKVSRKNYFKSLFHLFKLKGSCSKVRKKRIRN